MKIIFMGTPEFSVPILESLIKNYDVVLVVTKEDKIIGRNKGKSFPPIKQVAIENNIPVFQPQNIRKDYQTIIDLKPDLIITCAYGQIIPKELLDCPRLGCINVHASLLPKLRGGAPIHHAIIDGYKETGITIMYMDEKMDTGDIISSKKIIISDEDNTGSLHEKLSFLGKDLLLETLPSIIDGTNKRMKQDESLATYAYNIKREDEFIDFNDKCLNIFNKVRGLYPWPLGYILINGEETKVLECNYEIKSDIKTEGFSLDSNGLKIPCLDGFITITKIKPFGKTAMHIKDYYNGLKDKAGLTINNKL